MRREVFQTLLAALRRLYATAEAYLFQRVCNSAEVTASAVTYAWETVGAEAVLLVCFCLGFLLFNTSTMQAPQALPDARGPDEDREI